MIALRLLSTIIFLLLALTGPVWLLVGLVVLYALYFTAYEVLLVAALIEGYFYMGQVPYYLIGAVVLVVAIEFLKPRLSLYTT